MEILGIFWASIIISPGNTAAKATEMIGRRTQPQQPIAFAQASPWLSSLTTAYTWSLPLLDTDLAYQQYAYTASWLVPDLDPLQFDAAQSDETFRAVLPFIGRSLAPMDVRLQGSIQGVQPSLEQGSSDRSDKTMFDKKWESWSAVAAVRVEEPASQAPLSEQEQVRAVLPESAPVPKAPPSAEGSIDAACLQKVDVPYQESPLALKASPKKQVWLRDRYVGSVSGQVAAKNIATKLRELVKENQLNPAELLPMVGADFVGVAHRNDLLFVIDETMRPHPEVPATIMAIQWTNNLRVALDALPLSQDELQMAVEGLAETASTIYGTASWYGPGFHGRLTANGEIFDENALTAAHKQLPFNTYLKVTNRLNGKSVVVRINDRGPYIGQRSLDLSKAAAHCLGSTNSGVIPYEAVILAPLDKPELDDLSTALLSTKE